MTGSILISTLVVLMSFSCALAAPVVSLESDTTFLTQTVFSFVDVLETITQVSLVGPSTMATESLLLLMPPHATLSPSVSPSDSGSTSSSVIVTKTAIEVSTFVTTVIATPTTITVSAAPSTVTDVVTVFLPESSLPTAQASTWAAPAQMTDLSAFNISTFAGGKQNMEIVNGIPANASATAMAATAENTGADYLDSIPPWDNSTSVLQLLYPADSINPGNSNTPQGGAQFYATPLQINEAQNISLEYSILFPVDFNWVLAGKLPGLYGGHTGCSGGDDALTCFSTRLMWRAGGIGELYLYAPKDKQTTDLCNDPQSFCDAAYGLSIGRGAFNFAAGAWTHVRQTVSLNTPGQQDGEFTLHVNGRQAIHRSDVFYRDIPPPPDADDDSEKQAKVPIAAKISHPEPTPASASGGLLGSLLGGILRRQVETRHTQLDINGNSFRLFDLETTSERTQVINAAPSVADASLPEATTVTVTSTATRIGTSHIPTSKNPSITEAEDDPSADAVGFTGLFFSTFFGGHEQQYATPVDQYVWFKDFAMAYNS